MTNQTAYAVWMGCGALLSSALYYAALRGRGKALPLCALTLALGALLGALCAKLVFYVAQIGFMIDMGWLESLVRFSDTTEFSYYGGAIGVCLGVFLAAKLLKFDAARALNLFAPAGALMAALARFGEYFLGMQGTGMYMEESGLCFFPLAVRNEWDESYLAVFMLEGLLYLIVFIMTLTALKGKHLFMRTVFYLCLPQILCESLRNQGIFWLFVRVEQLMCVIGLEAVLILYGVWLAGEKRRFLPALIGLVAAAVFVGLEFALDKTEIPHIVTYAVMTAVLALLMLTEIRAHRRLMRFEAGKA